MGCSLYATQRCITELLGDAFSKHYPDAQTCLLSSLCTETEYIPPQEYTLFQNDTDGANVFVMFGLNIFRILFLSRTVIAEVKLWSYTIQY